MRNIIIVLEILFVTLIPILSFTIRYPAHVFARANAISLFSQNLPTTELTKELVANTMLSLGMFLFTGNNNPILNPGMTTMYDRLFVLLALIGLIYLLKKDKKIAIAGLVLLIPSFINDIFSYEPVPGTRFYGMGHPATTRVLGFIPILIFFFISGIVYLDSIINNIKIKTLKLFATIGLVLLVGYVGWHNWNLYFNQKQNEYIYNANHVPKLQIVQFINYGSIGNTKVVAMSKILYDDPIVQYFSKKDVQRISLKETNEYSTLDDLPTGVYILLDVFTAKKLANQLTDEQYQQAHDVSVWAIPPSPWGRVDTLIIYRS